MSAQILDGKALAASIKKDLAARTVTLKAKRITPGLGTVLVGDDPGSHSYVSGKHRDCQEVGINSIRIDLPATATQADVLAAIKDLNSARECTGYIVQLPLPKGIDTQVILEAIDPDKDADGLHPMNLGRLVAGYNAPLPCTPRGIVELINHYKISLAGAEVVVIGRGLTVGRPLGLLLSRKQENATVTLTHTGTKDLAAHTKRAWHFSWGVSRHHSAGTRAVSHVRSSGRSVKSEVASSDGRGMVGQSARWRSVACRSYAVTRRRWLRRSAASAAGWA